MREMELFSVIIPVYNVAPYLHRCLDSVLAQTYLNLEIILVNDGSTDDSEEICLEYVQKDSRVQLISKENGGLHSARNAGLERAAGDYIWFVDSDDYVAENLAETVQPFMREYDFCGFEYKIKKEDGTIEHRDCANGIRKFDLSTEEKKRQFFHKVFFYHETGWEAWGRIFRREIIEQYHLRFWDTKEIFAEDHGFVVQYLLHAEKIIQLPDCLYFYQKRKDSIMYYADMESRLRRSGCLLQREAVYIKEQGFTKIAEEFYLDSMVFVERIFRRIEREESLSAVWNYREIIRKNDYIRNCMKRLLRDRETVYQQCGKVRGRRVCQMFGWIVEGDANKYIRRQMMIDMLDVLAQIRDKMRLLCGRGENR